MPLNIHNATPLVLASAKTLNFRASAHFPVESAFVEKAEDWLHSSAADYLGVRKEKVELIYLE